MKARFHLDISVIILIAVILGGAGGFFGVKYYIDRETRKQEIASIQLQQHKVSKIPTISSTSTPKAKIPLTTTTSTLAVADVTGAINLDLIFFPQAPKKIWDADLEEYCEEASLLAVDAWYKHKTYSVDEMEAALSAMKDWEIKTFGYFQSTSVEQTAQIAREYLGYKKIRVIDRPTIAQIRAEIVAHHPVIVPANGKLLKNPYFKNGGPMFHMVVVRGFTESGDVIVNDPGTQFGENFVYSPDVILSAMADWDHGQDETQVATGIPRVLVVE
ncbi:MAG: C39 family peptidase [Candidatus Magasanikbacteria bacterium]|nr:C39 family peptidase [Candidatus Magasanikbacteria bacterium]